MIGTKHVWRSMSEKPFRFEYCLHGFRRYVFYDGPFHISRAQINDVEYLVFFVVYDCVEKVGL